MRQKEEDKNSDKRMTKLKEWKCRCLKDDIIVFREPCIMEKLWISLCGVHDLQNNRSEEK